MSLYHEAAELLQSLPSEGSSLKARVFGRRDLKSPPAQLYALVVESCKWSAVLREVIERAGILKHERKLTPQLSLLLVHDLLLAKGGVALPQGHGLRQSVERHRGRLSSELTLARLRRKLPTLGALREEVERASSGEESSYPRWVRVNTLKSSVEEQLETTFAGFGRAESLGDVTARATPRRVFIDAHVPGLLAVTPGTDLSRIEAYASGKIILQDKASCFPAYLLDPRAEDGDVVDACAAPGNKTTHLAAILHSHRPEFESPAQTIFAFEKDARRARTLDRMVTIAGSRRTTRIGAGQDFLQVNPTAEAYKDVGALLLDPSCSGSGIVGRDSMPELHLPVDDRSPGGGGGGNKRSGTSGHKGHGKSSTRKRRHDEVEGEDGPPRNVMVDDEGNETVVRSKKDLETRLEALSSFQVSLVLHALSFPGARKVTYSTCSVHAEENEQVVMRVLGSETARRLGWRILAREDQVSGMREWPVRGVVEACGGDEGVAGACIRSYKGDGRGVMGFFVAGFVRCSGRGVGGAGTETADGVGPYLQDGDGAIVRDVLGIPMLRSTRAAVSLEPRREPEDGGARVSRDGSLTSDSEWDGFGD